MESQQQHIFGEKKSWLPLPLYADARIWWKSIIHSYNVSVCLCMFHFLLFSPFAWLFSLLLLFTSFFKASFVHILAGQVFVSFKLYTILCSQTRKEHSTDPKINGKKISSISFVLIIRTLITMFYDRLFFLVACCYNRTVWTATQVLFADPKSMKFQLHIDSLGSLCCCWAARQNLHILF